MEANSNQEPVLPSGVLRVPPGGYSINCEKGGKLEHGQDRVGGSVRHSLMHNEGSHHSNSSGGFQKLEMPVPLPDVSVNLVNIRSPGREISGNTQKCSTYAQSQMSPGKRKRDTNDPKKDASESKMDTIGTDSRMDTNGVECRKDMSDNEDMKENKEEQGDSVEKIPIQQTSSGRSTPVSARGRRGRGRYQDRGEVMESHICATSGMLYEKGDCIYLDSQRADQPYFIACVHGFRKTKRDNLVVDVKWYYRPSEVPDSVYQLLVSDRVSEGDSGRKLAISDPVIKSRELFISDATDTYPVHALRGKCTVKHFQDVLLLKDFVPDENTFYYVLGYNPETKRLATTQGEIRVGSSHQARLPELRRHVTPADMPESLEDHEELRWKPASVMDGDLIMYLRAARSMAAFAGMCDGGSTDDGCQAASMDETTINAMDTLHKTQYDTGRALQELVKRPVPRSIDKKWAEEDTKRFVKGLRQHGKNFFRIRKELLPYKETGDLVEFYYYWKKTPSAANNRPHRKHRRPNVLRRQPRTPRPPSSEYYDLSSASEVSDNDSDDSDSRDLSGYACRHCFTTSSKDWHHAGKDKALLCTECRIFFKKYGEERPVDKREPPPFMFKPVREDDALNGKHNMRTRRSKEQGSSKNRVKKERQAASSPDNIDSPTNSSASSKDIAGRKSPSTVSTCSNSSTDKDKKKSKKVSDSPLKGKKRPLDITDSEEQKRKKAQERPDSPAESSTDSSSVCGNDNDENGNEGDIENNQEDDLSSSSESTAPSPIPTEHPDGPDFKTQTHVAPPPRNLSPEEGAGLPSQLVAPPVVTQTATPVLSAAPVAQQAAAIPTSRAAATPPARGSPTPVLLPAADRERLLFLERQRELDRQQETERQLQESRQRQEAAQQQQQQQQQQVPRQQQQIPPQQQQQQQEQQVDSRERDFERQRQLDLQRELDRQRDLDRQRELEFRQRDFERQREVERQRDLERQHEAEKQQQQLQPRPPSHPGSDLQRGLVSQAAPLPLVSPTANVVSSDRPREAERPPSGLPPHPSSLTTPLPPPPPLQGLGLVKGPPTHVSTPQSLPPHPHSAPSHPTPPPPAPPLTSIKQEVIDGTPDLQHPHKPLSHRPGLSPPPPLLSQQQQQGPPGPPPSSHHPHHPHPHHTPPPHLPPGHQQHPSLPLPHQYHPSHLQSTSTPPHLHSGPPPPHAHSPHLPNNHLPPTGPQIQIKQERPPTPPRTRSPLPRPSSRSKSPMKSLSPTRPRSRSPLVSRSRSRSPASSPEPERRSPSPEPRIVNEQCHTSANAIFIRHIWRGYNSCARCDIESKPLPDSKLARKREERLKRAQQASSSAATSSGGHRPPSVPTAPKEDKRTEPTPPPPPPPAPKKEEDNKKRLETPPLNPTADAQVTSTLMTTQIPTMYGNDRLTPGRMGPYQTHDPTPALRQLSEYARPHAMGQASQEPGRAMAYGMPGGPSGNPGVDPMLHYRMASMYPPGSRERLELELQRDKQERDARERDLRERELRDMEFREKMKQELEMKPPGFDRLPPGATLDPHWLEIQRRYGGLPPGTPGANGPHPHMPGVYPPASLANDLIQRERERIERLGLMPPGPHLSEHSSSVERLTADRLAAERMSLVSDPMLRLQMAGAGLAGVSSASFGGGPGLGPPTHAHTHTHAHSHTHLHLHPEHQAALSALQGSMPHPSPSGPPPPHPGAMVPTSSPSLFHPHHPRHPLQSSHLLPDALQSQHHPPPPPPSNGPNMMARNLMLYEYYQRQATYDPMLQRHMNSLYPMSTSKAEHEARPDPSHLVYHFSRADPLAAAAAQGAGGVAAHQPGHPSAGPHQLMAAAREQEMMYRELLSRPPYSTDPVLAHQVLSAQAAQHEALQRQLALEREGLARHLPPH